MLQSIRSRLIVIAAGIACYLYIKQKRSLQQSRQKAVLVYCRESETEAEITSVNEKLEAGLDFFQTKGEVNSIKGRDDVTIKYVKFQSPAEKATILFLTGWSESIIKYGELFKELYNEGCTVVAMDHRSQGLSSRPKRHSQTSSNIAAAAAAADDDHLKTHVEDFHDHVVDALMVVNQAIAPINGRFFYHGIFYGWTCCCKGGNFDTNFRINFNISLFIAFCYLSSFTRSNTHLDASSDWKR